MAILNNQLVLVGSVADTISNTLMTKAFKGRPANTNEYVNSTCTAVSYPQ